MSAGPHRAVIDRGASLVTDAADVLELVSPVGSGTQAMRRGEERARDHLPAEALAVLEALPARAARDAGQLAVAAGIPLDAAIGALGLLGADGWVERARSRLAPAAAARLTPEPGACPGASGGTP